VLICEEAKICAFSGDFTGVVNIIGSYDLFPMTELTLIFLLTKLLISRLLASPATFFDL
jgi:hypothetical protein